MKKFLTLLLVLVAATGTVTGTNNGDYYLTFSQTDTLRISPNALNFYINVPVIAEFENGVCDHWRVEVYYPITMSWSETLNEYSANGPDYGINIPYTQSDGSSAIYEPTITTIQDQSTYDSNTYKKIIECSTTVYGYWDYNNDGIYEPYGKVKWGPGRNNRFFDIHFSVSNNFTGGSIVIDGQMSCSYDSRSPTHLINDAPFYRVIYLVVAYQTGDVNGDDMVNMYDVTALIDYLNGTIDLNQYQLAAADINGDGNVTIADVSVLIDLLLGQGTYNVEDFEDL